MTSEGSPGIWFKFYDYNDKLNGNVGKDAYTKFSFATRQGAYLSLINQLGYSWPTLLNFTSHYPYSNYYYSSQGATIITAPMNGYY